MKYIVLALLFTSCFDKTDTPESALIDYVSKVSSSKQSKEFFLNRTTGNLQAQFENMSDEQFEQFTKFPNVSIPKLKILFKRCEESKCILTYTVRYHHNEKNKSVAYTEVKKTAELVKVEDSWKIAEVNNIKTFIDSKKEVEIDVN